MTDMPEATRRWLDLQMSLTPTMELRAISMDGGAPKWCIHDDVEMLWENAVKWSGNGQLVTTSLQQRSPGVHKTSNDGIDALRWILLDFDPERPRGVSATDIESRRARRAAETAGHRLIDMGWSQPGIAFTGSGTHLLFPVALGNTAQTRQALNQLYKLLETEFATEGVHFDTTVKNAGRCVRLYGLPDRKYRPQPGRSNRPTAISLPDRIVPVTPKVIGDTIKELTPPLTLPHASVAASQQDGGMGWHCATTFRIDEWAASEGLYIEHISGNKHLITCPWQNEHGSVSRGNDTIVFTPNGERDWAGFFCHHSSCTKRSIRTLMREYPGWKHFAERRL